MIAPARHFNGLTSPAGSSGMSRRDILLDPLLKQIMNIFFLSYSFSMFFRLFPRNNFLHSTETVSLRNLGAFPVPLIR